MTHDTFIRAIQQQPEDEALRLVYADWLEDQGDERAEYLRTELALTHQPTRSDRAKLRERLWQLWSSVDSHWLAIFTQPRMLRANPTRFESAWIGTGLEPLRECAGTYDLYAYESLPPLSIEQSRGAFQWLPNWQEQQAREITTVDPEFQRFPRSFRQFMGTREWQGAISSPTDCEFTQDYGPLYGSDGSMHMTFYVDSQTCVLWDIYLHPSGAHCVIAKNPDEEHLDTAKNAWFVAPSFETFIYRTWIEGDVWGILGEDFMRQHGYRVAANTPAHQAYIAHYQTSKTAT